MSDPLERDSQSIDAVVRGLYECITFAEGGSPDWARQERIFSPDGRMTRMSEDGAQTFSVAEYRANFERMMASGGMPGFFEHEVARRTVEYADLAHVWSTYEARRSEQSGEILFRGINSLQLVRRDGRWSVLNAVWFREGERTPIPGEYL
jgi:hypothetical protein